MSSPQAPRSAMPALLILALTVANGVGSQMLLSPLQEAAKLDMGLTDFQVSLVAGLAVSIPIALLAIPLGLLVDRVHRLRMLIVLALTWTGGNVLTGLAQSFEVLFVARMIAGIGMMCALPVAISIAADLSEREQRGRAMIILSLGRIVGTAAAFALGGWLLGVYAEKGGELAPWRIVHFLFAFSSALLILPLLLLREPARRELGEAANAPVAVALRAVWQRRALLAPLFLGQVTVVMADAAAAVWAAPVLIRDYQQTPEQFSGWFGAVLLLSGLIGSVVGGVGADLGQKGKLPGGLLATAAIAGVISIPAAFYPMMPTVPGFAWVLAVFLTAGSITGIVTVAALTVRVPNEIRGVCLGAFMVVAAVVGLGVAPMLVTLVSDAYGGEAHVRVGLTVIGVISSALSALGFIIAARADVRRSRAAA